jgi:lambda family phage portal protein
VNSYKLALKEQARAAGIQLAEDQAALAVNELQAYAGQQSFSPWEHSIHDGGKFLGGFGVTQLQHIDYWTLRQRSAQLFNDNLYARGLIRRLVTNEINTGLTPEVAPDEAIIGVAEDSLSDWSELVENRFAIWAKQPALCDWKGVNTFGGIERLARMEALVSGDVLAVIRQSRRTGLPMIQLIGGDKVQTPLGGRLNLRNGHSIRHGVELDRQGRVVAHHVRQKDGGSRRLPAFGEKSGRRISWLIYGTEKRLDEVRGQPLLSLVLQSLKEIDRYRDSTQRKAVINSVMAMFIKKGEDKMGTLPVTGGAVRKDQATVTDNTGATRNFNMTKHIPGVVMEELQTGEEPVLLGGQGTDTNFGVFEEAIMHTVAWANEIPPEILTLAFSNNYSASQAAINEFKIYLNLRWAIEGETFCTPIYIEWLVSETLLQKTVAPGFLAAWRDPRQADVFGAWICAEWYGSIKPSTDMLKQVKASELLVAGGYSTRAREARITTGTKWSKNAKRLKQENAQLVEAMRPLAEFRQEFGDTSDTETDDKLTALIEEHIDAAQAEVLDG